MSRSIVPHFRSVPLFLAVWLLSLPAVARPWPESAMASAYASGTKVPYLAQGDTRNLQATVEGTATTLDVEQTAALIPRHDVDLGRTRLVLRSRATKVVLLDETFNELWECLGYNPRTQRYLLVSKNEHGVKVTLRGLVYVDERKAAFVDSVFGQEQFHAVSSLYEPVNGILALIGWKDTEEGRNAPVKLYALHTLTDALVELGPPPAPPPLSLEDLRFAKDRSMMGPWIAPERHYTELDPAIWRFSSPTTLEVSYGRDTLRKRSSQRTIKRFVLTPSGDPVK